MTLLLDSDGEDRTSIVLWEREEDGSMYLNGNFRMDIFAGEDMHLRIQAPPVNGRNREERQNDGRYMRFRSLSKIINQLQNLI